MGQYYPLNEGLIPEAFQPWYDNRGAPPGKPVPIDGGGRVKALASFTAGCPGLQQEFAQSYYPYVMYRCALHPTQPCSRFRLHYVPDLPLRTLLQPGKAVPVTGGERLPKWLGRAGRRFSRCGTAS